MKRFTLVVFILFFTFCAAFAQSSPPYNNVSIYYHSNISRTQFDAITPAEIQQALQKANNIIYKTFYEIISWDDEDDSMITWVHQNKILPGTSSNRENGDMWEVYVGRFETDGWYIRVRWSSDDGYTYLLYYYNRS